MGNTSKHSAYCFTWNNYTEHDVKFLENVPFIKFLAFGREVAKSTGTPHLQGFLWLHEPRTQQQIRRKLPGCWVAATGKEKPVSHWIHDDGKTGFGYCFKEHCPGWVLQGIPPTDEEYLEQCPKGQGARCDLLAVKKKIDEGEHCTNLLGHDEHFVTFASHVKFFEMYQAHKRRRLAFQKPTVIVHYGGTGLNKTRDVYDSSELDDLWIWDEAMGQWFDGYAGHDIVLFEEYRSDFKYGRLLSLLDGYPNRKVPVKNGFVDWSPKLIYLTSPLHPSEWYPNLTANDKIDQLMRRIDQIKHYEPLIIEPKEKDALCSPP